MFSEPHTPLGHSDFCFPRGALVWPPFSIPYTRAPRLHEGFCASYFQSERPQSPPSHPQLPSRSQVRPFHWVPDAWNNAPQDSLLSWSGPKEGLLPGTSALGSGWASKVGVCPRHPASWLEHLLPHPLPWTIPEGQSVSQCVPATWSPWSILSPHSHLAAFLPKEPSLPTCVPQPAPPGSCLLAFPLF